MTNRSQPVFCSVEGCEERHGDLAFEQMKAHGQGWFTQADGTTYCPQHVPEWVAGWRARKAQRHYNKTN